MQPDASHNPHNVQAGQIWKDNDPEQQGAIFTVDKLFKDSKGRWKARVVHGAGKMTGSATSVLLMRFSDTYNGYENITAKIVALVQSGQL